MHVLRREEHGFYFDNLNNLLTESHIVDTLSGLLSWHDDERRLLLLLSMLVGLMRFRSENASWNIKIVGEEIYRSDSRRVFCSSGGESIWILSFATTSGSVYRMNTFAFFFCATPALRIVNYIFIIVHFGDKFINNLRTGETYQRNDLWAPHVLVCASSMMMTRWEAEWEWNSEIGKLFTMFVKVCSSHSCFIFHKDPNRWGRDKRSPAEWYEV